MVLLSKLLNGEQDEIEDALGYMEQFKESGILRAEGRTKTKQFQAFLLGEIAWLSQHGSPWSKLHPPHSGSVRTAPSAAALCWLLDERSGNETTSPHNIWQSHGQRFT